MEAKLLNIGDCHICDIQGKRYLAAGYNFEI